MSESGSRASPELFNKLKAAETLNKSYNMSYEDYYDISSPFENHYVRIFSFCRLMKITNLYDIGCGDNSHAFMLSDYPDMFYIGIDRDEKIDFTYINKLFSEYSDERIKFVKGEYPFIIAPDKSNIAIACYSLGTMLTDEKSIKNTAAALSKDFERILMHISLHKFNIWKAELADFQLHELSCNSGLFFGTKYPDEISFLKNTEFDFDFPDEQFHQNLLQTS